MEPPLAEQMGITRLGEPIPALVVLAGDTATAFIVPKRKVHIQEVAEDLATAVNALMLEIYAVATDDIDGKVWTVEDQYQKGKPIYRLEGYKRTIQISIVSDTIAGYSTAEILHAYIKNLEHKGCK